MFKGKLKNARARDAHYLLRGFRAGEQAGTLWAPAILIMAKVQGKQLFSEPKL